VLISMLFIILAARVNVEQIASIAIPGLLVLAAALFIARPLSVALSSIGSSLTFREGVLLSWIAPRGIVAAAISALFAIQLEGEIENAALIVPLTFVVIIGTVVVHSLTAGALARWLGLSSRGEQGVLITSSSKVGLLLGEALRANDIKVLVADTYRDGLHEARMSDMQTFYGNPLSEHADRYMDLTGYNWLWAVSPNAEANAIRSAPNFQRTDRGAGEIGRAAGSGHRAANQFTVRARRDLAETPQAGQAGCEAEIHAFDRGI
jgi:NhaP-type Na+/H+ or K+/H+ antiporter